MSDPTPQEASQMLAGQKKKKGGKEEKKGGGKEEKKGSLSPPSSSLSSALSGDIETREFSSSSWADEVPPPPQDEKKPAAWGAKEGRRWESVTKPAARSAEQPREQQQQPREQQQQQPREQPREQQQQYRGEQQQQPRGEQRYRDQQQDDHPRDDQNREQREYRERAPRETFERRGFQIDRNAQPHKTEFPTEGPFKAYIGNIPFSANEEMILHLFDGLQVTNFKLMRDQEGALKGFGYAEFESLEDLRTALEMNGAVIQNRAVRVDLPETKSNQGPAEGNSRDSRGKKSDVIDDWRVRSEAQSRPPQEQHRQQNPQYSQQNQQNRGQRGPNERYRDGQQDRQRESQPQRNFQRTEAPTRAPQPIPEPSPEELKNRPKLNLLPKGSQSKPSSEATDGQRTKPDPFGGAKPRDELEAQRRVEERRKEREAAQNRTEGSS